VVSVLPVGPVVRLLHQLLDEIPQLDLELDVVMAEIRAQRLATASVAAQLSALETQLGVLESSLAPMQHLSHRWKEARTAIGRLLSQLEDGQRSPEPGPTPPPASPSG
jgi:hypothetical protein